jgi:hypothetical protein
MHGHDMPGLRAADGDRSRYAIEVFVNPLDVFGREALRFAKSACEAVLSAYLESFPRQYLPNRGVRRAVCVFQIVAGKMLHRQPLSLTAGSYRSEAELDSDCTHFILDEFFPYRTWCRFHS